MEKKTEAIVESLLGEESLSEGDVHGLTASMDMFDRVFTGSDLEHAWGAVQAVRPEVWGHLPGEVVGNLKSKFDTARTSLATLVGVARTAVAKAAAYKPPKDFPGYDSAAHSGGNEED